MALDFETYLLASSPPGFQLLSLNSYDRKAAGFGSDGYSSSLNENGYRETGLENGDVPEKEKRKNCRWRKSEITLEDHRIFNSRDKHTDQGRISNWETNYTCNLNSCLCLKKSKNGLASSKPKKVTFADENGLELEQIRVANEPSNVPPVIRPDVIEKLEQNLSTLYLSGDFDNSPYYQNSYVPSTLTPPFVMTLINFTQPAADYVIFRERIERLGVSLENIMVHDNCVAGTIKVKNLSYVKSVNLRCTFNSWKSFKDIPTLHIIFTNTQYETFSFDFEIPPVAETNVEFAVCYNANGVEYWDNNGGDNYKVVCINCELQNSSDVTDGGAASKLERRRSIQDEPYVWNKPDSPTDSTPYW